MLPHEVGIHGHRWTCRDISGSKKLLLKAFLVFPFIKQSELINQNSIYKRHTASNNRFEWSARLCDYFIFHANLNTRKKRLSSPGLLLGWEIECTCNNS